MTTFHIENLGCRATQADAAAIDRQLVEAGCVRVLSREGADIVVLNTCTVTAAADQQARQTIAAIAKRSPSTRIIVTGCYAQRSPDELAAMPGVTWVVGNVHQEEIARLASDVSTASILHSESASQHARPKTAAESQLISISSPEDGHVSLDYRAKIIAGDIFEIRDFIAESGGDPIAGHTRPTLKIQDGCDNRCAYCVIPFVRGRSRSMRPDAVINEIGRLIAAGAREIVLSGINLGSYGRDLSPKIELVALLRRILNETPLARLRLSSIEPMDVTGELIEFAASTDRFAQHFHMPLQSGSDRILAGMRRWYRAAHYAEHAKLIREMLPDAAIGADVIAGFPGETAEDHDATLELIRGLPFSYLHVFSFSERAGTKAATLGNHLSPVEIHRRAKELRRLGEAKQVEFRESQSGKSMRVLTLETKPRDRARNLTRAISGNYLDLRVRGNWPPNLWLEVQIVCARGGTLEAERVLAVAAD